MNICILLLQVLFCAFLIYITPTALLKITPEWLSFIFPLPSSTWERYLRSSSFCRKIAEELLLEKKKWGKTLQLYNSNLSQLRKKMSNPKSRHVFILKETRKYGTFVLFYYQSKAVWKAASCSTKILRFLVHSMYVTNGNYGVWIHSLAGRRK